MKQLRFLLLSLVFSGMLMTLWQCAPSQNGDQNSCKLNSDCPQGEVCVRQLCKKPAKVNDPPVANAGKNQRVRLNSTVQLDGSASSDPNSDALSFSWRLLAVPNGSKAALDKATTAKPVFDADVAGIYEVELVVKDKGGLSSEPAKVEIEVYGPDQNGDPIASAGADQVVPVGSKVSLDGSASTDPEGDKLSYKWTLKSRPDGSKATLSDDQSEKPSFTADVKGKYTFELVVDDGLEKSQSDTVTVSALDDFDLEPKLTSVDPKSAYQGTTVKVKLKGTGFSTDAVVVLEGNALPSKSLKFVDASTLELSLDLGPFAAKKIKLKIRNPNLKESNEIDFEVLPIPKPELTELKPLQGAVGMQFELTIKGKGFLTASEVMFEATPLVTVYKSETELTAKLDLRNVVSGKYKIAVRNPGGLTSKEVEFVVLEPGPPPTLKVLNPPYAIVGTKIPFSVHGTGFMPGAVIVFAGKAIPSKRVRRDEVQAAPDLDLTNISEGKYKVHVRNPDGQKSNDIEFVVEGKNPTPSLDRILPFSVFLNDVNTLYIYGQRFRKGAKLFLGSTEISGANLSFKSNTYMEATVDTNKGTWKSGDVMAYILNPGGKKSNTFKMTISNRMPTINGLTPSGWTNKCDTDVSVSGTNFIRKSTLTFGSIKYTPTSTTNKLTYVSDKELRFKLPAKSKNMSATTYNVAVDNGPGAKSAPVQFRILSSTSIPTPQIREVRPSAAPADTKANLVLYYQSPNYFYQGAVAYFNGKKVKTTCSSTSTTCYNLGVELDLTGVKPGTYPFWVENPCGVKSKVVQFVVTNPPKPFITKVSPSYAEVGDTKYLIIEGQNFTRNSTLNWGGKELALSFKSDTSVTTATAIDFSTAKPGEVEFFIDNKNGATSQKIKFTILPGKSTFKITSVGKSEFERGKSYNGLVVTGAGFKATTKLWFNGKAITTKFNSAGQLTGDGLDFTKLAPGTYYISAKDGSKETNKYPLHAKPFPPPVMNYISPSTSYVGRTFTMYIYGNRFCKTSGSSCSTNPNIVILDKNGKDFGTKAGADKSFNITRAYLRTGYGYVYGTFNSTKLKAGTYKIYFELPTGERSAPAALTLQPPPAPVISALNPNAVSEGVSTQIQINGQHFVRGSFARIGLQTLPTTYSSTSRILVNINGKVFKKGSYKLAIQNPDGQLSNVVTLLVIPKIPPLIHYTYPDVATPGSSTSISLYGKNFTNNMTLTIDGKKVKFTYYGSSSTPYIRISSFPFPRKTGSFKLQLTDSAGDKSNVFEIGNRSSGLYITYLSPDFRYTTSSSTHLYVYGYGFTSKTQVLIDGKVQSISRRSSTYLYISRLTLPRKVAVMKVQVKEGTQTYGPLNFSIISSSGPYISYMRASAVTAGVDHYSTGQFYVSGSRFTRSSKIYLDGKLMPTRYSSSSRLYVNAPVDFRKSKVGHSHFQVKNGSVASNYEYVRIETTLMRGNRPRLTYLDPYVGKVGQKVTIKARGSYLYSSNYTGFQALIEGQGKSIALPLKYVSGYFHIAVDLKGWKAGLYNVFIQNKGSKEKSGGGGFVIVP